MTISWRQFLAIFLNLAWHLRSSSFQALFHDPHFNKNEKNLCSPDTGALNCDLCLATQILKTLATIANKNYFTVGWM